MRRKHAAATAALALAVLLVLAACGGEGSAEDAAAGSGAGTGDGSDGHLSVGIVPVTGAAPLYVGIEEGFFEEEGLEVEPEIAQDGATIITSVLNGELQLGFAAVVPLINARAEGIEVKMIAGGGIVHDPEGDPSGIYVAADSDIQRPADLAGKQVAVNALEAIAHLVASRVIAEDGGDPGQTRFVVLPLPNMLAALEAGEVDAIVTNEPFVLEAENAGLRSLSRPYSEVLLDAAIAGYFAGDAYIEANPDVVEGFYRALDKAAEYANEHPDAVKEAVLSYTDLAPEVIDEMLIEQFQVPVDEGTVEVTGAQMIESGFIPSVPPADEFLHTP